MRAVLVLVWLSSMLAQSGIVDEVRTLAAQQRFPAAQSRIDAEFKAHGTSPDLVLAESWLARAYLFAKRYDDVARVAGRAVAECRTQLKTRAFDAEPRLPLALGAALEAEAQALAARGARDQAVRLLQTETARYRDTSIRARLQKNLNLLTLEGKPAPPLEVGHYLGPGKPPSLAALSGHPVLLFFWAHWCSDCKAEIPVVARLAALYGPRGLVVVGPTQHYGYVAGGLDAPEAEETRYIEQVRQQYYAGIPGMTAPLSEENLRVYGVSTTPTLVLVDKGGIVRMYHPGAMGYDELAARVLALL
jgi:thiol-disulfide isomerase/thioredoxin